jgi:isoleucyl-tRNA synthetase
LLGTEGKTPEATKLSIFMDGYVQFAAPDQALLAKWSRIREIREAVNKDIETLRAEGLVGSSLQANVSLTVSADDHLLLSSLGDDLKFVFITSAIDLVVGDAVSARVSASRRRRDRRCAPHYLWTLH